MSVHVVIQPTAGFGAEVIEPLPGVRQLIAGAARIGGLADTARSLAAAANDFADRCDEKERDKSISVEIAADVQPVPPETVGNLPFRPVVLEGLTVQPRGEASGQAKWITWVIPVTGLRGVDAPASGRSGSVGLRETAA